jgi:uncharacterized protein YozE (UPF0346 family)
VDQRALLPAKSSRSRRAFERSRFRRKILIAMPKFTPFHEWLAKQRNRKSPLGAWARNAVRDETLPKDLTSADALVAYLRTKQASGAEIATARLAWQTYARDQK